MNRPHTTPELLETPVLCSQCIKPITHRPYIQAQITVEMPREGFARYSAFYSLLTFHPACATAVLGEPTSNLTEVRNLMATL